MPRPKPLVLIILDGWGYAPPSKSNAISLARTPTYDKLLRDYPNTLVHTSGRYVGLPTGQMGNSEVGHLNIGAGRIVYMDITRLDLMIENGELFRHPLLLEAMREAGGDATFIETDVTKEESVKRAIAAAVARYGKLNVLYNCAGGSIPEDNPVTEVDMSVWQHTMSLDLLGPFLCCRHGIPEMIKAGGGSIVNMSSAVALRGNAGQTVYAATKAGLVGLTRSLAREVGVKGITVNALCPGLLDTDMTSHLTGPARAYYLDQTPVGRAAHLEEVASVVRFRMAEEASYVNGVVLPVDGGLTAAYVTPE